MIKQKLAGYLTGISPVNQQLNTCLQAVKNGLNTGDQYNQNTIRVKVQSEVIPFFSLLHN
jgi:hypothetical protein